MGLSSTWSCADSSGRAPSKLVTHTRDFKREEQKHVNFICGRHSRMVTLRLAKATPHITDYYKIAVLSTNALQKREPAPRK